VIGEGRLLLADSEAVIEGSGTVDFSLLEVNDGELKINRSLSIPEVLLNGGNLDGTGKLTVTSSMDWTNGSRMGGGATTVIPSGVTYTYDSAGRQIRQDHGNGTFTTFAYHDTGQVTQIEHHAPDGTVRSSYTYEYDDLGRRTSATTDSGTTEYGYDVRGQLTSVALPGGRTIEYVCDSAGRRLEVIDQGAVTNYVSNELEQYMLVGDASYDHDADGNLVRIEQGGQVTSYAYDDYNRLVQVEDGSNVWTYEYDAPGQRVASTHNGVRTEHLVDPLGLGNVAAEYDDDGALLTRYLYTGDGPQAQISPSGDASYYELDASGSVVALTDDGGAPLNQYEYLPFGGDRDVPQHRPAAGPAGRSLRLRGQ
jgi:YD repeat-containing protein